VVSSVQSKRIQIVRRIAGSFDLGIAEIAPWRKHQPVLLRNDVAIQRLDRPVSVVPLRVNVAFTPPRWAYRHGALPLIQSCAYAVLETSPKRCKVSGKNVNRCFRFASRSTTVVIRARFELTDFVSKLIQGFRKATSGAKA
jgi:hypothetical protein